MSEIFRKSQTYTKIIFYKLEVMHQVFLHLILHKIAFGTCGLSVTTFFHQVLNYYYLTVYIMFKPKMSLEGSVH